MVNNTLVFEELPAEEQRAVSQLKKRMVGFMSPELFEDLSIFLRFLRARDFNVNAAEHMLKNHLEWRKAHQVETILTDYTPKEVAVKYFPFSYMGLDKDGAPILYFHVGGLDARGIFKACRKADVVKSIIQFLETNVQIMKKQSLKLGKYIGQWTMILNFEGLSFAVATHKQTLEVVGNLIVMYEANYPERLKAAYFLNASLYFTMAFSVVKHFLSGPTYKKIRFFGKEGWKEELLKAIDAETLPKFLGGARTDPDGDPTCKTQLRLGGAVPPRYFLGRKEGSLLGASGAERVSVPRMSKAQLTLGVREAGAHIEWEFETRSRDIGFSLLFQGEPGLPPTPLIPKQRIETDIDAESGMFKCERPGVYIIEFDNTYSWIHQKEIFYRLKIVKDPGHK